MFIEGDVLLTSGSKKQKSDFRTVRIVCYTYKSTVFEYR